MNFQIHALSPEPFNHYFSMAQEELDAHKAVKMQVTENPGTPCRVSMADAEVGDTVILLNYDHQPNATPYQSNHAIFVRENVAQARLAVNEVPPVLSTRLISMRLFDENHMMIDAEVLDGQDLQEALSKAFNNPAVAYGHLHNAKPGCFAAHVTRSSNA